MHHQRLRPPERRRHLRQLDALAEGAAGLEPAGELEREHRTAHRHLSLRHLALRMRIEARVRHVRDGIVPFEELGHGLRGLGLLGDAHVERADAS